MRVVTPSLACWPNSGHSSTAGASRSSLPRLASACAHNAVAPLVQEKTMLTVSRIQGALVLGSAMPPHRSTTVSPATVRQDRGADLALALEVAGKGFGDALE